MLVTDIVGEYLRNRGYPDFVVEGGLARLVRSWEATADSVASGKAQDQDEYLNDMDGRRILEEPLGIAPPEERTRWLELVRAIDAKIGPHLVPTVECIWGETNAAKMDGCPSLFQHGPRA